MFAAKIRNFKFFLLIVIGLFHLAGFSSILTNSIIPNNSSISIKTSGDFLTLTWNTSPGRKVLLFASPTNSKLTSLKETKYIANTQYGKGTAISGGFVVYIGDNNSTTIKNLAPETVYFFSIYEYDASDNLIIKEENDLIAVEPNQKVNPTPLSPLTVYTVTCPPISGVTTSLTGTTNSGTSTASAAGCPHVGYASTGAMNPWTSSAGTGTISWMFSAPVSSSTLRMNSVNTNDYGTISASGGSGGSISLSGLICMGVSGLVVGPLSVAGYGGVYFNVNSTGSYTMVTLLNTGAQSGFVGACPTAITSSPLPIELIEFNSACNKGSVELNWKTITEKNNNYFTVESSTDAINWEPIEQVKGAGTSYKINSYKICNVKSEKGVNYYRLKQTDFDGNYKYSIMTSIENCSGSSNTDISIFPNPAKNELNINSRSNNVTIELVSSLGEKILTYELSEGLNTINTSNLSGGIYYLKASSDFKDITPLKLIIQK